MFRRLSDSAGQAPSRPVGDLVQHNLRRPDGGLGDLITANAHDWIGHPRYGGRDVETSGKSLEELAPPSLPGLSCCDTSLLEDDPSFAAAVASTDELLLRADPQFQL